MSCTLLTDQELKTYQYAKTSSVNLDIATADGESLTYSAAISQAIQKGSLSIDAGLTSLLRDDGNGNIVDENGAKYGTTDYTSTISLAFPSPPAQYTQITASYTTVTEYTYEYDVICKASADGYMYMYLSYKAGEEDSADMKVVVSPDNQYWFEAKDDSGNSLAQALSDGYNFRTKVRLSPGEYTKFIFKLVKSAVPNVDISEFNEGQIIFGLR